MNHLKEIGFMQGRLSPLTYGRIQSFPTYYWKEEMYLASRNNFHKMEWTVDTPTLVDNPILTFNGAKTVSEKSQDLGIKISSLTCDFFMENPPWKKSQLSIKSLTNYINRIFQSAEFLGPLIIVLPILENSSLTKIDDFNIVIDTLEKARIDDFPISIAIESDLNPSQLIKLIKNLPHDKYGINLDTGNSAAFGFDPTMELETISSRILNVHLKDREFGGGSVRFGMGSTKLREYIVGLKNIGYTKNLILQSFRSTTNSHLDELRYSRDYVLNFLREDAA